MDLTATIIPWEGGKAILATFRDVSDRESAFEALRESEEALPNTIRPGGLMPSLLRMKME